MAGIEITCVTKDNDNPKFETITHYGFVDAARKTFYWTKEKFISWLEETDSRYAYVGEGPNQVCCEIRVSSDGNKFLRTEADGKPVNNLIELDLCQV